MLSRDEVIWGYRFVLGRDPESDPVIEMQRQHFNTIGEFRKSLLNSPEFNLQTPVSNDTTQYLGYRAEDLAVFEAFGSAAPEPMAGFVTDFHGSRARVSSLWDGVQHLDGVVLPIPVPGDYHADTAEWLGVLKAVLAADNRFAAMELGAGMGPWLVAGAVAARIRGIDDIRLLGVEGDPDRFALMQQNFRDNRIDPNEHTLICGGVGVRSGKAKWPRIADFRNVSGARPVRQGQDIAENPDRGDLNYLEGIVGDELIEINIVAFDELLTHQPLWDLVHIDVQGTGCVHRVWLLCHNGCATLSWEPILVSSTETCWS
jgi:hypothetical protein